MKSIVDADGRLFGRVNLVDALCVAFVLGLVPVAYASLLLFRTPAPRIGSVARAEVNREDRRIANGQPIQMKLKVRGEHLTPVLRAFIDDIPAIGFAFEDPTSADVIVGDVPIGTHDLILYDGVQEVARAARAVTRTAAPGARVRIVGALIQLDRPTADGLHDGQPFVVNGEAVAELMKLGPVQPDRHPLSARGAVVEAPVDHSWSRSALVRVSCEPDPDASVCHVGTTTLGDPQLKVMDVPGAPGRLRLLVGEILPDESPRQAMVRVRVAADRAVLDAIHRGDRDMRGEVVDERNAVVADVRPGGEGTADVVVRLGLDRARDGWRYKAQSAEPGAPFSLVTERYSVAGEVVDVVLDAR